MKKFNKFFTIILLILLKSCDTATGPNEIGGNTDLALTKVGNEFGVSVQFANKYHPALSNIRDTIKIIKNQNGIVTFKGVLAIDELSLKQIDTLLGLQRLSENVKRAFADNYKKIYNFSIDSSDKQNIKAEFEAKFKITSEGIQDFIYSKGDESKPFTIVKYSANIGDKYEFTTAEGVKITRVVTHIHTTEDWELGFLMVKTTRVVEETPNDPLLKQITYIGNHKYGLVGLILETKDNKIFKITIMPWDVL